MGQNVSKTITRAIPKRLQRVDPTNTAGFGRGQQDIVQSSQRFSNRDGPNSEQHQFLQQKGGPVEMPPDLVQFLKDVGPVQKRAKQQGATLDESKNKPTTAATPPQPRMSPSVEDDNISPLGTANDLSSSSRQRRRQFMPLASNVEGFETERTTNFSSSEERDPNDGYDVLGLYRILISSNNDNAKSSSISSEDVQLLEDTRKFLQVPVIVRDSDDSFVGVHPQTLETQQLSPIPKTIVKLVLEDLVGTQDDNVDTAASTA